MSRMPVIGVDVDPHEGHSFRDNPSRLLVGNLLSVAVVSRFLGVQPHAEGGGAGQTHSVRLLSVLPPTGSYLNPHAIVRVGFIQTKESKQPFSHGG